MVPCADEVASGGAAAPGVATSGETGSGETAEVTDSMQTVEEEPDKNPSWQHKTVLFFLQECIKRKADLRNPKIRRRNIFLEIQKVLREKAGVSFSITTLDTKLKNMKLRYHKILDNNKKTSTGRGRMPWPYFDLVSEVFEAKVRVKDAPTISSMNASSYSFPGANHSASEDVLPSTSSRSGAPNAEAPRCRKNAALQEKFLNIEEKRLEIAQEIQELKELTRLRKSKLNQENVQRQTLD